MTNMVFRERILINSMLSMAPNIVFAPNIRRTQTPDARHKQSSFPHLLKFSSDWFLPQLHTDICEWGLDRSKWGRGRDGRKLTKPTYDKQHFYNDVRDDWRSFWRHKGSVVRNDDRYVECTEKNQPIPADFKYPIMQQDEPWPFDFLYFVFWKSVCLNSS